MRTKPCMMLFTDLRSASFSVHCGGTSIGLFFSSRNRFCPSMSIMLKSSTQTLKGFHSFFSFSEVVTVSVITVVVVVVVFVSVFSVSVDDCADSCTAMVAVTANAADTASFPSFCIFKPPCIQLRVRAGMPYSREFPG